MTDKPYLCPDCGAVLARYWQRLWDNCHETTYPAFYCRKCQRTFYQTILDLPVHRVPQQRPARRPAPESEAR